MRKQQLTPDQNCPVSFTLEKIGGKWKPLILFLVNNNIARFGEMGRAIPGISKQMLTRQLRELEADGLLTRTVFAEVPPRVEYALSDLGRSILPVIAAMRDWGAKTMASKSNR